MHIAGSGGCIFLARLEYYQLSPYGPSPRPSWSQPVEPVIDDT